jgi:Acetyltransferase (GNAT) domain
MPHQTTSLSPDIEPRAASREPRAASRSEATCPLWLDGWLGFNRIKWKLQPLKVRFPADHDGGPGDPGDRPPSPAAARPKTLLPRLPAVAAVFYLDRRGRLRMPPLNPYLPLAFHPTAAQSVYRLDRQWLTVSNLLVQEMRRRGLANTLLLPPEILDVRPWQWAGFNLGVAYTFTMDLPHEEELCDAGVRKSIAKAARNGFLCERTRELRPVLDCLQETETRQGFRHRLDLADLELGRELLGAEHFRSYLCRAPNGEPASGSIVLSCPGGRAIAWVTGNKTLHRNSGATQLLMRYLLDDLYASGAVSFDFVGADIPHVSAAKASWGGRLIPYYSLRPYGLRQLAAWTLEWWRYKAALGARRSALGSGPDKGTG